MLFKRKFNKGTALEVITEGMLFQCDSMHGASYVDGLCTMARELGLLTQHEYAELKTEAYRKGQAAEKEKAEQRAAIAAQRKAERAAKAKAAKEILDF